MALLILVMIEADSGMGIEPASGGREGCVETRGVTFFWTKEEAIYRTSLIHVQMHNHHKTSDC